MELDFKKYQSMIDVINVELKLKLKIQSVQHYQSFCNDGSEYDYSTYYYYRTDLENTLSKVLIKIVSNEDRNSHWYVTISRRTKNSVKSFNESEFREMKKYILAKSINEQKNK